MIDLQTRLINDEVPFGVKPVLLYKPEDTWGVFSNFSNHRIACRDPWTGERRVYLTAEYRYQAMKATNRDDHEYVANALTPLDSKKRGRQIVLRPDWSSEKGSVTYYIMLEAVIAKATLHSSFRRVLSMTGKRPIYENSPYDPIWGIRKGDDYSGKNLLGEVLMDVRVLI